MRYFFCLFLCLASFSIQAQNLDIAKQFIKEQKFQDAETILTKEIKRFNENAFADYFFCLMQQKKFEEGQKISQKFEKKLGSKTYNAYYTIASLKQSPSKQKEIQKALAGNIPQKMSDISRSIRVFRKYSFPELALALIINARNTKQNNTLFAQQMPSLLLSVKNYDAYISECLLQYQYQHIIYDDLKSYLAEPMNLEAYKETLYQMLLKMNVREPENITISELFVWVNLYNQEYDDAIIFSKSMDLRHETDGKYLFKLIAEFEAIERNDLVIETCNAILSINQERESYFSYQAQYKILNASFQKLQNEKVSKSEMWKIADRYKNFIDGYPFEKQAEVLLEYATILGFYLQEYDGALENLQVLETEKFASHQAPAEILKGEIMMLKENFWEASLIFMRVIEKNKTNRWSEVARFKNATCAYFKGDFKWALAQLQPLKGKPHSDLSNDAILTSLFINDNLLDDSLEIVLEAFKPIDFLLLKHQDSLALLRLDTVEKTLRGYSIMDDLYFRKALIYEKLKQYHKAVEHYERVYQSYFFDILADEALIRAANLYEKQGNREKAKVLLERIITQYKDSLHYEKARKKLRELSLESL